MAREGEASVMVVCAARKEKGDEREKREKDDACGSSVVRSSLHRFLKVPWSGVWLCAVVVVVVVVVIVIIVVVE